MRTRVALAVILVLAIVSCGGGAETTTTLVTGEATTLVEQPVTTSPAEQPATSTMVEGRTISGAAEAAAGEDPCVLVPAETVASIFAATSASGAPGIARQCTFTLVEGLVPTVEVFHYGSSAYWEEVKAGFEENRGGGDRGVGSR